MTYKNGFIIGGTVGVIAWLYAFGGLIFLPNPTGAKVFALGLTIPFGLVALVMTFIGPFRHKAIFSTAGDGFIIGFTACFALLQYLATGEIV